MQISNDTLELLRRSEKNLLAFSGGNDSSALFFILKERDIEFDIAIVDYGIRESSKYEIEYAKELCQKYNKTCHTMKSMKINSNFELEARRIRYDFFHSLISQYGYENLITAHHFNDRLEWFFMQFTRGCGLNTLLGFKEIERIYRDNISYNLIRPLINIEKNMLVDYNNKHHIKYFYDSSNDDSKYLRNLFRKHINDLFTQRFYDGMRKSFEYLKYEYDYLYPNIIICEDNNLFYTKKSSHMNLNHQIHTIDILSKRLGYVMSAAQRNEIIKMLDSSSSIKECIMGDRIIIAKNDDYLFVAQNLKSTIKIPKSYRDRYRKEHIPPTIRKIIYITYDRMGFSLKKEDS